MKSLRAALSAKGAEFLVKTVVMRRENGKGTPNPECIRGNSIRGGNEGSPMPSSPREKLLNREILKIRET